MCVCSRAAIRSGVYQWLGVVDVARLGLSGRREGGVEEGRRRNLRGGKAYWVE